MSSEETPNVPSPRHTREAVREKAQRVRAHQSRVRVMRRVIIGAVAVAAVGGIGVAVALAVTSTISKPELSPTGMEGDGVIVHDIPDATAAGDQGVTGESADTGSTDASATEEGTPAPQQTSAVDVQIYVDYLSSGAGTFERSNARLLSGWITDGIATVTYHPVSVLTQSSNGTKYSLRAAAAAACVATHSPDTFYDFNHELLIDQPEIDTDGRSDEELATLAAAAGVDNGKDVKSCIEDQDYLSWAKDATTRALEGPLAGSDDVILTGAPMVLVNGQAYVGSLEDPAEFAQFVLSVASETDETPQPSDTPAPEATENAETPAPEATEVPVG